MFFMVLDLRLIEDWVVERQPFFLKKENYDLYTTKNKVSTFYLYDIKKNNKNKETSH